MHFSSFATFMGVMFALRASRMRNTSPCKCDSHLTSINSLMGMLAWSPFPAKSSMSATRYVLVQTPPQFNLYPRKIPSLTGTSILWAAPRTFGLGMYGTLAPKGIRFPVKSLPCLRNHGVRPHFWVLVLYNKQKHRAASGHQLSGSPLCRRSVLTPSTILRFSRSHCAFVVERCGTLVVCAQPTCSAALTSSLAWSL